MVKTDKRNVSFTISAEPEQEEQCDTDVDTKEVTQSTDQLQGQTCGLCLDDVKGTSDLDVVCHRCHFRICYECMFEYIRFNKTKETLLCPHCRQDMLDNVDLYESIHKDANDSLLSMYLIQNEVEKLKELFGLMEGSSSESDSIYSDHDSGDEYDYDSETTDDGSTDDTDDDSTDD
jgi:hypothetical protein